MRRTQSMRAALAAVALAAGLSGLGGCTPQQWAYMQRQNSTPPDYNKVPLGQGFDEPKEFNRLDDENLRRMMQVWSDLRQEYLRLWRKFGDEDQQTKDAYNRMIEVYVSVQYYADQLGYDPRQRLR